MPSTHDSHHFLISNQETLHLHPLQDIQAIPIQQNIYNNKVSATHQTYKLKIVSQMSSSPN